MVGPGRVSVSLGGGSVHSALNGVQIKVRAYLFGNDSACGSVIGGVFHLAVKLIVSCAVSGSYWEDLHEAHHCLCFELICTAF